MRTLPILAMGAAAIVTDACTDQHGNYDSERTRQTMSDLVSAAVEGYAAARKESKQNKDNNTGYQTNSSSDSAFSLAPGYPGQSYQNPYGSPSGTSFAPGSYGRNYLNPYGFGRGPSLAPGYYGRGYYNPYGYGYVRPLVPGY